jgi:hypothetical protein
MASQTQPSDSSPTDITLVQAALASCGLGSLTPFQILEEIEPGVLGFTVPTFRSFEAWYATREVTPYSGYWPVILCDPADIHLHTWVFAPEHRALTLRSVENVLRESDAMAYGDWMVRRHQRLGDYMRPEDDRWHMPWPVGESSRRQFWRTRGENTLLGLFPTTEGWQCPAYWHWSIANAYLKTADHCCVMRRWEHEYGAELVMMFHQAVVQFRVTRPPRTRRAAMKLAVEHYLYCTDRVDQGAGTIERLAAQLLDAPVWYFWFD